MDRIMEILFILPGVIVALTVHEFAHGFAAYKLGDYTAKYDGRLSLNPMRHIDPFGLLFLIIFRFGWAKPVQVSPNNFKNPKIDMALTAVAGPIANFITAFVLMFALIPIILFGGGNVAEIARDLLQGCIAINLSLGFFNMLPIPPLDGSKIFGAFLPANLYFKFTRVGSFGTIILLALLWTDIVSRIIGPLVSITYSGMATVVFNIFSIFIK